VVLGQEESRDLGHPHIGTEHLLLGLLRVPDGLAARVLGSRGLTLEGARSAVVSIGPAGDAPSAGILPFTPRAKQMLELSLREALRLQNAHIDTEHLLLGLLGIPDSTAARVLADREVDAAGLREELVKMLPQAPGPDVRTTRATGSRQTISLDWLGDRGSAINGLEREIRAELDRAPDDGDLLLMLAAAPGTPAARALAELGVDLDDLQEAIVRARAGAPAQESESLSTETLAEIRRRLGLAG
jgi:ATP-dependent Clp protease ATP-binding subunit ClpA